METSVYVFISMFSMKAVVTESSTLSFNLFPDCHLGVSHETPSGNCSISDTNFSFLCSTFYWLSPLERKSFLQQPSHCCLVPHHPFSSLSWRGHTQGSNESTQGYLQEAGFQRPSCITVTMEIGATVMTHTGSKHGRLLPLQTTNQWSWKNLYILQFVTKQLCGVRVDPQCLQRQRTSTWQILFAWKGHLQSTV